MDIGKNRCRYLMDDGSQCQKTQVEDSQFCEQHAQWLTTDLEVYKAVTEHFRQDVREFWSRSNFYLVVQAGLLSVFVSLKPQSSGYDRTVTVALGALGLLVAVIWFLVARGSILWLRRWRLQTIEIDNVVDRHKAYTKVETFATISPLMSPSNLTQYLPVIFTVAWVILLAVLLRDP